MIRTFRGFRKTCFRESKGINHYLPNPPKKNYERKNRKHYRGVRKKVNPNGKKKCKCREKAKPPKITSREKCKEKIHTTTGGKKNRMPGISEKKGLTLVRSRKGGPAVAFTWNGADHGGGVRKANVKWSRQRGYGDRLGRAMDFKDSPKREMPKKKKAQSWAKCLGRARDAGLARREPKRAQTEVLR